MTSFPLAETRTGLRRAAAAAFLVLGMGCLPPETSVRPPGGSGNGGHGGSSVETGGTGGTSAPLPDAAAQGGAGGQSSAAGGSGGSAGSGGGTAGGGGSRADAGVGAGGTGGRAPDGGRSLDTGSPEVQAGDAGGLKAPPYSAISLLFANCVFCHHDPAQRSDFQWEVLHRNLINKPATKLPAGCAVRTLVIPGDPLNSLVYLKVAGKQPAGCGAQMPPKPPVLTAAEVQMMYDWILAGAPATD